MTYDKVTHGWVTQSYVDGECVEQSFFEGEEDLIRRENDMGDEIEVDVEKERKQDFHMVQPTPTEIDCVIREGELDIDPERQVVDVDNAIDQCCRLMDKSCAYDILGTPLFRAKNGRYYTIELTAEVLEANLQFVEEEIENLLADYRVSRQSETSEADTIGVDAELTKIAQIEDRKERVDAKMDLYNGLSELQRERANDEQS